MSLDLSGFRQNQIEIEGVEDEAVDIEEMPRTEEDIIEENKMLKENLECYKKLAENLQIEKNEYYGLICDYERCLHSHGINFKRWKEQYEKDYQKYGTHNKYDIEIIDQNMERTRALMRERRRQRKLMEGN